MVCRAGCRMVGCTYGGKFFNCIKRSSSCCKYGLESVSYSIVKLASKMQALSMIIPSCTHQTYHLFFLAAGNLILGNTSGSLNFASRCVIASTFLSFIAALSTSEGSATVQPSSP